MTPQLRFEADTANQLSNGKLAIDPAKCVICQGRGRLREITREGSEIVACDTCRHLVPLAAVPIPCPTCGGNRFVPKATPKARRYHTPCPDCSDGYWRGPIDLVVECPSIHTQHHHGDRCPDCDRGLRRVGGAVIESVLPVVQWGEDPTTEHITIGKLDGVPRWWQYAPVGTRRAWRKGPDVSHLSEFFPPGIEWAYILKDVQP